MTTKLEQLLKQSARKAGLKNGTDRFNSYVYGTLDRIKRQVRKITSGGRRNG